MINALAYQYWLLTNQDISTAKKIKLIEYFYNSFNVFNATKEELLTSDILKEKEIDIFLENKKNYDLIKSYESFVATPFSFITMESESFPEKLLNIYDNLYGFYYIGRLPDFKNCISIVGARRCSAYGKKMALELSTRLAKERYTIISGMARGVDTYSHRGCLEAGGKTIAVLGSGCDVIYPEENFLLYEEIIKEGAVLSEYPMGTAPIPKNFPRRNRIVSALSDIVIVIEARDKSGSLITADLALDQGKEIYVLPGRVGDSLSYGCNRLISQGAGIIYNVDKFIEELAERYGRPVKSLKDDKRKISLSKEEKDILQLFDYYPKSISTILEQCEMDYLKLLSVIYSLENKGIIYEAFKNNYVKYC